MCGGTNPAPIIYNGGLGPIGGDVWVMLGDSEMEGSNDYVPADFPAGYPPDNYLLWKATPPSSAWVRRKEADASPNIGPSGFFSHYLSALKGGRRIGTIQCGLGSKQSAYWLPSGGSPYANIVSTVNAALVLCGPNTRLAGFFLKDGANDVLAHLLTWRANWNTTIAALRTDIVGSGVANHSAATVPFIYDILTATPPSDGTYGASVTPTQWSDFRTTQQIPWVGDGPNRYSFQATDAGGYNATWSSVHKTCAGQVIAAQAWATLAHSVT